MDSNSTQIKCIDVSVVSDSAAISEALQTLGFLSIKAAGTPSPSQIDRMFSISEHFFINEGTLEKEKVSINRRNAGWVKVRQETLDVAGHPKGDIKEAFNMHKFTSAGEPLQPLPPTLSQHTSEISTFMQACHSLCMKLLEAFAQTLELPRDFFTSKHAYERPQGTVLRLLYYPPTIVPSTNEASNINNEDNPPVDQEGDIRAGAHSDYGSITLLFQKDVGGLQILLPNGEWLDAPAENDAILVNVGDSFDFWTGGLFKSTQHRVALPRTAAEKAQARYSIVYFLHAADDVPLSRIPRKGLKGSETSEITTQAADNQSVRARFGIDPDEVLTSKEWLERRLAATYTKGRKD
ncbi:hypothetical protein BOTBODRAFT_38059 [Botryobasidium botryosum FD-172 SS1]|uniref:Fe2OG dioxygenase domain-containing protein n=1 Tax=Botryobasidium botryosum (strain FD-172 SS1) TaxID=930990 RepID=A0A067LXW3_BOTB1|nr:hypothetical protein BOTBODRAFT_38059 [Botryobasidium botryosum FD-172 SS1]